MLDADPPPAANGGAGTPARFARAWAAVAAARIRALVRSNEFLLIPVALVVGVMAAFAVAAMSWASQWAHVVIFGIPIDVRLSAHAAVDPLTALAAPAAGGLILGVMEWCRKKWKIGNAVDPVEANALRGGKMSLRDSVVVSLQTLISNGCGASVGLEAGYTQIGSGAASVLGRLLNLRRNDLRLLVGCGAAAAISGAFSAPLTGALYACELIIGTYSVASAAPILVSSITAAFIAGQLGGAPYLLEVPGVRAGTFEQSLALILLAVLVGVVGIGLMYACAWTERVIGWLRIPIWIKPVLGGLCVGAMAIVTPQVLAAGHGAMALDLARAMPADLIIMIVCLKLCACVVSLSTGFRGGLFFASLFVGCLLGKLYAVALYSFHFGHHIGLDPTAAALTGMATLGVAIVGGPLTMAFLVLELTRSLEVFAAVLAACVATSVFVRSAFGHSFSTWRLHLRGETIRGASDIGWLRTLTVKSMMRTDIATVNGNKTIAACRSEFQLGSRQALFVVDDENHYQGLVLLPDLFANDLEAVHVRPIRTLIRCADTVLFRSMNVKSAMACFERAEADILAVVEGPSDWSVVGFLTEAYARRRYIQELDSATGGSSLSPSSA